MCISLSAEEINQEADNQRCAGYRKSVTVTSCKRCDILRSPCSKVGTGCHSCLCGGGNKVGTVFSTVKVLVAECRESADIGKTLSLHGDITHSCGSHRGKHRADIDSHIEQGECGITLPAETGVVVKIAYHNLKITLEQSGTYCNKQQRCTKYHKRRGAAYLRGDSHDHIAYKHHGDTGHDTLREAPAVGNPAAYKGHEIYKSEESCVNLTRHRRIKSEFSLQEQQENCEHCVVAEALAGIGKRKHIQSCRLIFKHR